MFSFPGVISTIPFLFSSIKDLINVGVLTRYGEIVDSIANAESRVLGANWMNDNFKHFLLQAKVREDLVIATHPNNTYDAIGSNDYKNGLGLIRGNYACYIMDEHAHFFALKHEIGHIKHNDSVNRSIVKAVTSTGLVALGIVLVKQGVIRPAETWTDVFLRGVLVSMVTSTIRSVPSSIFTYYQECKADEFAIHNSSDDELKGGRRYFIAMQEFVNESWFDDDHPSLCRRVRWIENELGKRGVAMNDGEEKIKILFLKELFKRQMRQIG